MARSDADSDARHQPACARCHTTGGFLDALGVRKRADASRDVDDAVVGIACSACHAVHGAELGGGGLVREVASPASLGQPALSASTSTLCANCHAPTESEVSPAASSAALWRGSVVLPARLGGLVLRSAAPHANVPDGCVGCHGGRAASEANSDLDHSFRVDPATCKTCHAGTIEVAQGNTELAVRARSLLLRIQRSCRAAEELSDLDASPLHMQRAESGCKDADPRAQAFFAAALVLEDRAAFVHNAPFARSLLTQAEALLQGDRDAARPLP